MHVFGHRVFPAIEAMRLSGEWLHLGEHESLGPRQKDLVEWLEKRDPATLPEIAEHLGVDQKAAQSIVDELIKIDFLVREADTDPAAYRLLHHCQELAEAAAKPTLSQDEMRKKLVGGISRYVGLQVISLGLGYVTQLLMARILGSSDYGFYSMAVTMAGVLAYVASLGFPYGGLQRFIPQYLKEETWPLFKGLVLRSVELSGLAGVTLVVIAAPILWFVDLPTLEKQVLAVGMLMVPVAGLAMVFSGVFQSLKRWIASYFSDEVFMPTVWILVILAMTQLGDQVTVLMLIIGSFCVRVLSLGVEGTWMWVDLPKQVRKAKRQNQTKKWLGTSLPVLIATLFGIVVYRADLLFVGSIRGTTEAGIYAAVLTTTELFGVFLVAANTVGTPELAPLFKKKDMQALQHLASLQARLAFTPALVGTVFCAIFGTQILRLFGEGFDAGYTALLILLFNQLVKASIGAPNMYLVMSGNQMRMVQVYLLSAVVDIVLLVALVPSYGMEGAAIGSMVAMFVTQSLLALLARQKTGIRTTVFGI
jgi:O-antigen/teichoic acid export membrane protein